MWWEVMSLKAHHKMHTEGSMPPVVVSATGPCPGLLFPDLAVAWDPGEDQENKREKGDLRSVVTLPQGPRFMSSITEDMGGP